MSKEEKDDLMLKVDAALNDVRPHLAVDGGNVEIVDITDEFQVKIKWMGNCESCSMSAMTMRAGIEQAVMNKVPAITGISAINGIQA